MPGVLWVLGGFSASPQWVLVPNFGFAGWLGLDQRCICTDFVFDGLFISCGQGVGV